MPIPHGSSLHRRSKNALVSPSPFFPSSSNHRLIAPKACLRGDKLPVIIATVYMCCYMDDLNREKMCVYIYIYLRSNCLILLYYLYDLYGGR